MPVSAPPKKGLTLLVVAATLVCQLLLCRSLGRLSTLLSGSISDAEGDDVLRYEAARALLTLGQLWTAASLGVAIAGLVGIAKSILPVLRLVALHGFLDLSVLLVLLSLLSFLSFSSPSFSTSLCQFLSSTELLSDVLGFGLEECEARWKSLAMGTLGVLALVAGCRAFAAVKSLQYYVAVTKRAKRGGLKINTSGSGVGRLYSDSHGPSRDSSSPSSHKQRPRIFLLPSPLATKRDDDPSIPLLSLTPSSPAENTSFPPIPYVDDSEQSTPTTTHHVRAHSQEQMYIVYAPVRMTAEEARALSASEVVLSSHSHHSSLSGRPRSRSQTTAVSPVSGAPSSGVATPVAIATTLLSLAGIGEVPEEEAQGIKLA